MDLRLFHAARLGDIQELHAIMKDDRTALEKLTSSPIAETPLHIATLTEQAEFVKEITRIKPSLVWEANKDGIIPLHMACATGNLRIVHEFLEIGAELGLVKDKNGRNGLHFAAIKGRVLVLRELLYQCPKAAKEVTVGGDTALHLAVKHGHFDAFKALVEGLGKEADELVDTQDGSGKTVAQLAKATKQIQVEKLLRKSTEGEIGERQSSGDGSGSVRFIVPKEMSVESGSTDKVEILEQKLGESFFRSLSTGMDRMVPVVAGLITSVTFVAALAPPKTVWKENMKMDWHCIKRMGIRGAPSLEEIEHPEVSCPSFMFVTFASFNTAGFISAVLIIFFHPNSRIGPLLLLNALIFLALTYLSLTIAMSPNLLTFLMTYGVSILAFLFVIIYMATMETVMRHCLRKVIVTIRKFRQRSEDRPDRSRWRVMFCC